MSAIFTGTTKECFLHFDAQLQKSGQYFALRKEFAKWLSVSDPTLHRWLHDLSKPNGETLVRLRFYLHFLGYEVQEISMLLPAIFITAQVCAFGVVSAQEIVQLVGYKATQSSLSSLFLVFRGQQGVSDEKLKEFESLAALYSMNLVEKMEATPNLLQKAGVIEASDNQPLLRAAEEPPAVKEIVHTAALPVLVVEKEFDGHEVIIESLAGLVQAMLPLAEALASDAFTPEERKRFREIAGAKTVFKLSNRIFSLNGEKTRAEHTERGADSAISKGKKQ